MYIYVVTIQNLQKKKKRSKVTNKTNFTKKTASNMVSLIQEHLITKLTISNGTI